MDFLKNKSPLLKRRKEDEISEKRCGLLTPSASSTTGTGVDLRLETTSLSPLLLALTKYWSERTGQDWSAFDSLCSRNLISNKTLALEYYMFYP